MRQNDGAKAIEGTVVRVLFNSARAFDFAHVCYSLELPKGNYGVGCAIPPGRYEIKLQLSPGFGRVLPELLDVPGRSEILIHVGNWPKNTKGCILVGEDQTTLQDAYIGRSKASEEKLIKMLAAAENAGERNYITVIGA